MADTFASLLPENADISGYLDGVEAVIVSCRTTTTDYNGTVTPAIPALGVQYAVPSLAKDKQPRVQHYSAGDAEHRIPSDDGKRFKLFFPDKHKGVPKDSNAFKFIQSILNAPHVSGQGGFPRDRVSDDVSVFEGMRVRLKSEALDKVSSKKVEGQKDSKASESRTIILVDQIIALPWEQGAQQQAAAAPPAATQAPAQAAPAAAPPAPAAAGDPLGDANAVNAATDVVVALLADEKNGGAIDKAKLGPLSFRLLSNNPSRLNATKLLSQQASAFLPTIVGAPVIRGENMVGTVGFDGSKVTLVLAA